MGRAVMYPFERKTLVALISTLREEFRGAEGFELPILSILLRLQPVEHEAISELGETLSEICGLSGTSVPRILKLMEKLDLITFQAVGCERFEISLRHWGRFLLERILASLGLWPHAIVRSRRPAPGPSCVVRIQWRRLQGSLP